MSKKGKVITIILVIVGLISFAYFNKDRLWNLYLTKTISKETNGEIIYQVGDKLPASFPAGFPVYPGAKVTSSWTAKGENGDGTSAIWETSADPGAVAGFYKTELAQAGWQMSSSYEQQESYNYSFSKGNNVGLVGITKSAGSTTISVAVGNK